MRSNAAPLFERVAKVFGGLAMSHSDEPRTTGTTTRTSRLFERTRHLRPHGALPQAGLPRRISQLQH